jgi:hypothetical protein
MIVKIPLMVNNWILDIDYLMIFTPCHAKNFPNNLSRYPDGIQ